ncbi:patatin-like phospholipase family protein [Sorangium sp. So ce302]|uniref:patatin-like phospholipase family protein n=1 Tax=Sorangium sp. So ce302 TaxID=3133297 RepID=UPI003F6141F3
MDNRPSERIPEPDEERMPPPAAAPASASASTRDAEGVRPGANPPPQRRRIDFVLEGGGVKGIALAGAISAIHNQLEQRKEYGDQFTLEGSRAAGTSAGAAIAALLVAGYTPAEIRRIIAGPEIARLVDTTWLSRIPVIGKPLDITVGLLTELGAYRGDYFLQYLQGLLLDKGISTFKDIIVKGRERETNPLLRYRAHFVASDITRGTVLVLPGDIDAERYGVEPDDLEVALAVRMSMSVPFFFRPVRLRGTNGVNSYIVDGGLLSNFPVEVFDELHWAAASRVSRTAVAYLCLAAACAHELSSEAPSPLDEPQPVVTERYIGMGPHRLLPNWADWCEAAHSECKDRRRITGFYTGGRANGGYDLICIAAGADVHEVTPEDLSAADAVLEGTDINRVHWVNAAEAAQKMCMSMGRLAGRFTGRQFRNKYELVCLGLNVQRFNIDRSEVGDLRTLAWDEAGQMADELCRARGSGSGFFSGRRLNATYELICLP